MPTVIVGRILLMLTSSEREEMRDLRIPVRQD